MRCDNSTETMKVKQIVNEKLGSNYEVLVPKVKCPRLRVTNIDVEIPKDSIIDELKKNNDIIQNDNIVLITVIPKKHRSYKTNEIVIETKSNTFNKLLSAGKLILPWRECKVYEHIHVKRCYKCCGFFHNSDTCKTDQKCSRCAGPHKYNECKAKNICCVNCKMSNEKYKTSLNAKHHSWDKECPIYKKQLSTVINKIEYNQSE